MRISYISSGSVRGSCGHNHRTVEGAFNCVKRDRKDCFRQRGYSDRWIKRSDGLPLSENEMELINRLTEEV